MDQETSQNENLFYEDDNGRTITIVTDENKQIAKIYAENKFLAKDYYRELTDKEIKEKMMIADYQSFGPQIMFGLKDPSEQFKVEITQNFTLFIQFQVMAFNLIIKDHNGRMTTKQTWEIKTEQIELSLEGVVGKLRRNQLKLENDLSNSLKLVNQQQNEIQQLKQLLNSLTFNLNKYFIPDFSKNNYPEQIQLSNNNSTISSNCNGSWFGIRAQNPLTQQENAFKIKILEDQKLPTPYIMIGITQENGLQSYYAHANSHCLYLYNCYLYSRNKQFMFQYNFFKNDIVDVILDFERQTLLFKINDFIPFQPIRLATTLNELPKYYPFIDFYYPSKVEFIV